MPNPRIISPYKGLGSGQNITPGIIAEYTASGNDYAGQYDEIHIKTALVTVDFELPLAALFPGKRYTVKYSLGSGVGAARVKPYSVSGADQVEGSASPYAFTTPGDAIILESNGISSWDIKAYYPAGGTPLALPAATSSALGGVKITGTPASAASPTVPVLEADGFVPESALDLAAIAAVVAPNASDGTAGLVLTDGNEGATPAHVAALTGAGGTVAPAVLPPALSAILGAVAIVGTPINAGAPRVPVIEAPDGTIPSSVTPYTGPAIRAGQTTITSPATSAVVTFSSAMPNANYAVTLTQDAAIVATNADVTTKTVNGFTIALSAALTVTYNWIAVANT